MNCQRSSISAYVDGCHCDGCREAEKLRRRRSRNNHRKATGATEWCLICDAVFHTPTGVYIHEALVHDRGRAA